MRKLPYGLAVAIVATLYAGVAAAHAVLVSSSPASPRTVMRSSPHNWPMIIENSGMAATRMAAIAVPMRGVA